MGTQPPLTRRHAGYGQKVLGYLLHRPPLVNNRPPLFFLDFTSSRPTPTNQFDQFDQKHYDGTCE